MSEEEFFINRIRFLLLTFLIFTIVSSVGAAADNPTVANYAYITNYQSNSVSVIDMATATVVATVDVEGFPVGVAATPDGRKVYVTNSDSENISVIDTATNTITATVNAGYGSWGIVTSPDGKKAYVTNLISNNISLIDTTTNTVTATIDVGSGSNGIAITPEGTKVYVTNQENNTVSVIDTATNAVISTISVGSSPKGIAANPHRAEVYVANGGKGTVSIINTDTNTVTTDINVGYYPSGITVNPAGTKIYVTDGTSNTVSIIDTENSTVTATVSVGNAPEGVSVSPDGTNVYVANSGSDTVSVIDSVINNVTATVNVGSSPYAFGQFIAQPLLAPSESLIANFTANTTSGFAPLIVQFNDNSENATFWFWDFGDGLNSTDQNPVHTFESVGNYTVNLTAANNNGTFPENATATIIVSAKPEPLLPVAKFSSNLSGGYAPLTVQFNDASENATSLTWDFGDGTNSTDQNPVHTFESVGNYIVNLTVSNENGNASKTATISVSGIPGLIFPVANFETNVSSGYIPLSVQFTDRSQNTTSRSWIFGDGASSTDQNPAHTYASSGTYTVYLVASNGNGTSQKTATINVYQQSSGGSSGGSSSGGSGGGGAGGSPESEGNIEVKGTSQAYVSKGNSAKFDFAKSATCVVYVNFDAKKTVGKTTTNVEMLRGKSTLVSALPSGIIYKSFNIWVGNAGFANPNNIENAIICFKVQKAWIKDKKVDPVSITLNRYNDGKWNKLETSLQGEDNSYLYFTAKTPGFSPFVIKGVSAVKKTGNTTAPKNNTQQSGENTTSGVEQKTAAENSTESKKIPGFEVVYGISGLFALFLYRKTKIN